MRKAGTNSAVVANTQRYIAGQQDADGLHKLGARYYDPILERFTQMDPSGQEKNPYAYAGCNPINSKDPTGLDANCDYMTQIAGAFGAAAAILAFAAIVSSETVIFGITLGVAAGYAGATAGVLAAEAWVICNI